MIASVSTLARSSGTTIPFNTVNFSMTSAPAAHVDKMPGDRGGGRHFGTDQMGAAAGPLTAFELPVGGRGAALARFQPVRIHSQAHGTSRLAPLETRLCEYAVQPFLLGL